jgi:hypothetical protein
MLMMNQSLFLIGAGLSIGAYGDIAFNNQSERSVTLDAIVFLSGISCMLAAIFGVQL